MDNKLVEKARKLFALSKSKVNEHEALLAAKKLNELRLTNNLTRLEFKNIIDDRVTFITEEIIEKVVFSSKQKVWWRIGIIGGCAYFNNCCYNIVTKINSVDSVLIGTSTNVELSEIQLNYLFWLVDRLVKGEVGKAAKNAFRTGFSSRIHYRLVNEAIKVDKDIKDKQPLEIFISNEQKEGLILLREQEKNALEAYMEENYPNIKNIKRTKPSLSDIDAFRRGQEQGSKVGLNPRQLES